MAVPRRSPHGSIDRSVLLGIAAVGVAVLAYYAWTEWSRAGGPGFPLDDSYIHLQFARNLAAGNGLSYQDGILMPGSTGPLWTALLSVGATWGIAGAWAKALGAGLFLAAAWGCFRVCRELAVGTALSVLASVLFCVTDWMAWSALSGMEISLFVALWLWGLVWHLRERRDRSRVPRSTVFFAAAALARPEGLLLLLLAAVDRLAFFPASQAERGRVSGDRWALAAMVLVPVGLFFQLVSGSVLPTTFAVKAGGSHALWPNLRHLFTSVEILFRPQPWMLLLAGGGGLVLAERLGTEKDRGLLLPLWVLALPMAYATLSAPDRPMIVGNFGRYLFPILPGVVVLGVVALDPLARRLRHLTPAVLRTAIVGGFAVALLWPSARGTLVGASRYALNVRNVDQSDVAAGRWVAENLPADELIGVQDIGAIKYLAPNPVLDLVGLVNPEILPYLRGEQSSGLGGLFEFLRLEEPAWLILFPESYGGLGALLEMEPGLEPVHEFRVERNITMAGSRLVVLRTPWGRPPR